MNDLLGKNIEIQSYDHGKATLISGVCRKLNVPDIFDQYLSKSNGRRPDIAYGIMAQMLIANLCHARRPLYLMQEYFENIDIKGIFKTDAVIEQLNDDRFGNFLDKFYDAEPRKIFSDISTSALITYGLNIKSVNYDTIYNNETLDEVHELLERTHTDKDTFFYIADSALFTEGNLIKANDMKIKFITRAPETTNMAKEFVCKSLKERHLSKSVVFENAQGKKADYYVLDYQSDYKGIPVKLAACYSCILEDIKR